MDQKMGRNKNKTGLVLEGGGMRGIYTAGVLDVFLDEGLTFDGVIGVSAGAVHGCSFLSGQKGRSIRYYKKYCADKRFMSTENLIRTGNFADFPCHGAKSGRMGYHEENIVCRFRGCTFYQDRRTCRCCGILTEMF